MWPLQQKIRGTMWSLTSTVAGLSTQSPNLRGSWKTFPRQRHGQSIHAAKGTWPGVQATAGFSSLSPWPGTLEHCRNTQKPSGQWLEKNSPASHALFSSNLKFVQVTKHCPRVQTTRVTSPSREEWQRMNAKLFHGRPLTPTVAQASLSRPLFLFSRNYWIHFPRVLQTQPVLSRNQLP